MLPWEGDEQNHVAALTLRYLGGQSVKAGFKLSDPTLDVVTSDQPNAMPCSNAMPNAGEDQGYLGTGERNDRNTSYTTRQNAQALFCSALLDRLSTKELKKKTRSILRRVVVFCGEFGAAPSPDSPDSLSLGHCRLV
jgi:hypothetical protein